MYYQYIDFETGEKVYNPFNKYMVNERKIKLCLGKPGPGAKWFDFVIKQIQEDSESKTFTYTCKSQFVNELSKSGFDLVLDNELENNMGTIDQLAATILEGSDWAVGNNDNLKQYIEEPLYRLKTCEELNATNMETNGPLVVPKGEYIYAFYSHINDKVSDLQFLYSANGVFERDDKLVIIKEDYDNYVDFKESTYVCVVAITQSVIVSPSISRYFFSSSFSRFSEISLILVFTNLTIYAVKTPNSGITTTSII
jgi:hypothetical protein